MSIITDSKQDRQDSTFLEIMFYMRNGSDVKVINKKKDNFKC